jgi:hypothetical protein
LSIFEHLNSLIFTKLQAELKQKMLEEERLNMRILENLKKIEVNNEQNKGKKRQK